MGIEFIIKAPVGALRPFETRPNLRASFSHFQPFFKTICDFQLIFSTSQRYSRKSITKASARNDSSNLCDTITPSSENTESLLSITDRGVYPSQTPEFALTVTKSTQPINSEIKSNSRFQNPIGCISSQRILAGEGSTTQHGVVRHHQ